MMDELNFERRTVNPECLYDLLAAGAERDGAAPHLVDAFGDARRTFSFAEVLDLSGRGASFLAARLAGAPLPHVGVLAENSSLWSIAFYSAAAAGATVVPLDVRQTEDEIVAIVREASLAVLLVSAGFARFAERLTAAGDIREYFVLDDDWVQLLRRHEPLAASPATADSTAAIIYTSGTSGRSKGVVLTHGNILNQTLQNVPAIGVGPESRLLAILPLNHIFVFVGVLSCHAAGSAVVFLDSLKPARIVAALKEERITHLAGIPLLFDAFLKGILLKVHARGLLVRGIFAVLLRLGWLAYRLGGVPASRRLFGHLHHEFAPDIQRFICGGAKARPDTIRRFLALGYEFQEGYGLTETSGGIIINPPTPEKVIGTVGRPFGDTEVRILEPAPDGSGEIAIRGRSVFREYYRNPEDTAAAKTDDGWYRTGDVGRIDPRGNLRITGRAKDVIVLASGKKVAPDELDQLFSRSPRLTEAAAVGVGPAGAERIHLVVVPSPELVKKTAESEWTAAITRDMERLARLLPVYRRPQGMTIRTEPLPRTSTRKIKRGELRAWLERADGVGALGAGVSRPPQTLAEREIMGTPEMEAILSACSGALGRPLNADELSPATSLYLDLGMDSLAVLEMTAQLENRLQIRLQTDNLGWMQNLGDVLDAVKTAETVADGDLTGWRAAIHNVTAAWSGLPIRPIVRRLAGWLEPLDYGFITFIGKVFYRLRGHNLNALPGNGPFILAPNHVSYFDYPAVVGTLPAAIRRQAFVIGKKEVYNNFVGRLLSAIHRVIPVDRAGDVLQALQAGAQVLRNGNILYLHPEGTRSANGRIQTLKNGVAILACELGVPVVPVYIKGTYDVYPRGHKLPRLFRLSRLRRFRVEVFYGAPIDPAAPGAEASAYQAFMDNLRRAMETMEQQCAT